MNYYLKLMALIILAFAAPAAVRAQTIDPVTIDVQRESVVFTAIERTTFSYITVKDEFIKSAGKVFEISKSDKLKSIQVTGDKKANGIEIMAYFDGELLRIRFNPDRYNIVFAVPGGPKK